MAGFIAFNSIFWCYSFPFIHIYSLPSSLIFGGLSTFTSEITIGQIAERVFIYPGIPFLSGLLTRLILIRVKNRNWHEKRVLPRISPAALFLQYL
jgi:arsenite transporter